MAPSSAPETGTLASFHAEILQGKDGFLLSNSMYLEGTVVDQGDSDVTGSGPCIWNP